MFVARGQLHEMHCHEGPVIRRNNPMSKTIFRVYTKVAHLKDSNQFVAIVSTNLGDIIEVHHENNEVTEFENFDMGEVMSVTVIRIHIHNE